MKAVAEKPPYSIPSMGEIAAVPRNGFKVVSAFSGCGGSCLGYRMAGYDVVWANEFVPVAQKNYEANKDPACVLDTRDIRTVQVSDILDATGLAEGALDLLDGSPPCQAFSSAGKRSKGWGEQKTYEHGAKQCNEDLFFEYIRLLGGLMPKVFVAENVSGLVRGVSKGYFLEILAGLKECGYKVRCKILDAQWLGVPQSRQRTIFVGVREDLDLEPQHPRPLPYRYSIRDALPWVVKSVQDPRGQFDVQEAETDISRFAIGEEYDKLGPGEQSGKYFNLVRADREKPSPCILARYGAAGVASVVHPTEKRKFTIAELRRICGFPDDFALTGSYAQQWACLGNSVPPLMMRAIAETVRDAILMCQTP